MTFKMAPISSRWTGLMTDNRNSQDQTMPIAEKKALTPAWLSLPVFALLIFIMLSSCNKDVIYDDTKRIPEGVWNQEDKLRFEVPVKDTLSSFRFFLNIRHSTSYRYSNLYLFIHTVFPDGRTAMDTVECILARPDGKWLGKGISGIRDNQILLRTGLRFPVRGVYRFGIEQAMREESLEGVLDIGLRIEKQ